MRVFVLSLFLFISFTGCSPKQKKTAAELDLHGGLLYSGNDIQQLKKTADSLNLRYRQCEANPAYHSIPQTLATLIKVSIKNKDTSLLEILLKQHTSLQQIRASLPDIKIRDSSRVVLARQIWYNEYRKKYDTTLYSGDGNNLSATGLRPSLHEQGWLYSWKDYDEEEDDTSYRSIDIWRLDKPFASIRIPQDYAKMIQYVDCMIDTTTTLMLRKEGGNNTSFDALWRYVLRNRTSKKARRYANYFDEDDLKYIHNEFYRNDSLHLLLTGSVQEALEKGNGNEIIEAAVEGICSPDTILLMKRSRIVYGSCSMDDSPRRHARDIAVLASQTHQWPVFIRAHLDIMNDYFNRMSDGSYAEAGRKTYLRELELLDIPAQQLLLGTIFRTDNLPRSHYYGDINRIGRAFTESGYTAAFEKQIKSLLRDEKLDPFNKCLFFMLYTSYCYRQPRESDAKLKVSELKTEQASYPEYIRTAISSLK